MWVWKYNKEIFETNHSSPCAQRILLDHKERDFIFTK